jgi:predicted NBD/HSP70 family sugar kinase
MSMQRFRSRKHETAASNKTPRQINRNLIFHLVRTKQPVSRADLSRLTGLQRSTISLIVEELIKDGWLVEGSIGKLPRGRNPTFLGLNRNRAILAVDIHPTQTTIAVADIEGRIIAQQVLMLPQDANKALQAIVGAIRKIQLLHEELSLYGIGICLPGRTDLNSKKLIFAPNLKWPVLALKQKMERATGLRVKMDNVANACALSEVWFQSSDGQHDLVVVNVSEGIGTGIFVNGKLLRGERGMAGEFGHIQIKPDGPLCACGNQGCWETLASNRAAVSFYMKACNPRAAPTFETLVKMSQSGDQPATHALTQMAEYLGRGIRIISVALAPKEIVVVGEITAAWHTFGSIIEDQLKKNAFTKVPILRPAYDGNTARLRSAVALVLSEDPAWTENSLTEERAVL